MSEPRTHHHKRRSPCCAAEARRYLAADLMEASGGEPERYLAMEQPEREAATPEPPSLFPPLPPVPDSAYQERLQDWPAPTPEPTDHEPYCYNASQPHDGPCVDKDGNTATPEPTGVERRGRHKAEGHAGYYSDCDLCHPATPEPRDPWVPPTPADLDALLIQWWPLQRDEYVAYIVERARTAATPEPTDLRDIAVRLRRIETEIEATRGRGDWTDELAQLAARLDAHRCITDHATTPASDAHTRLSRE